MAIADTIQSMYDNVSNAYNVLEVAGADLTNVNKNILNLKTTWQERLLYFINNGTDVVWNNWDKVTGEGTTLTLNNTEEAPMKIDLKGNTSQATTTGKNLLINIRDEGYTVTSNGITFKVNADKSITVSGTATNIASMSLNTSTPVTLTAGTYTLSKKENSNVQVAIWYDSNSVFAAVQGTANTNQKTISQDTTYNNWRTLVVVYQGATVNTTVYPMLEKSSTATEYEPYTGGIPAPNPDFPQDIHVVSGDNSINVCGKNLLSFANVTNNTAVGITKTINQETITLNGTTTGAGNIVAKTSTGIILKAGTYTGSITTSGSYNRPNGDVAFYLRKDNTIYGMFSKSLLYMTTNGQYSSTFTLTEDTEVFLEIYANASNITFNNYVCKFQIEKGSTATTYEPYIGNTYPINLPVENLLPNNGTTGTINGVTFTKNADGSVLVNGTATSNTMYYLLSPSENISISAGNYYISGCPSNGSAETYRLVIGVGDTLYGEYGTGRAITISAGVLTSYIYITRGATVNNLLYKPMLEVGTKANTYVPYGTTPIELCKIGTYQDVIKKSTGKNLFIPTLKVDDTNISTIRCSVSLSGDEYTFSATGSDCYFGNVVGTGNAYNKVLGTLYDVEGLTNIVFKPTNSSFDKNYACYYNNNKVSIGYAQINNSTGLITLPTGTKYVNFRIGINNSVSGTSYSSKFQLEIGNQATSFEPYGTGWYVKKEIGKVVFTGGNDETWNISETSTSGSNRFLNESIANLVTKPSDSSVTINILSNNFVAKSANQTFLNQEGIDISKIGNLHIYSDTTKNYTVAQFKTWLSTHNTIVYYPLATPTYTGITDSTLISQLEAIKKSYNTQTNISQIPNDMPFELDVVALKELDAEDTTPALATNRGLLFTQPPVSENFINDEDDNSRLEETINEEEPNIEDNNREEEEPVVFFEKEIINNDEEQEEMPTELIEIDNGQR